LQRVAEQINAAEDRKCKVIVNCPADFILEVDWKLFHEAFHAVVENGIKYSPTGETVELAASRDGSTVMFRVVDKGLGIDPEIKEMIFDEFYSQHIENHTKGTALSLAIGKEIMNLHQGGLSVESVLGEGSSFIFTLPAASASASASK